MASKIQAMIESAKQSLNSGNKIDAQELLIKVVELDEQNEDAWLYLASALDIDKEKRTCLENVLIINPNNTDAKRMLTELDRHNSQLSTDEVDDLFGASFTDDAPPPPPPPTMPPATSAAPADDPFSNSDPFGGSGDAFGDTFSGGFDMGGDAPFASTSFEAPSSQPLSTPTSMSSSLFGGTPEPEPEPEPEEDDDMTFTEEEKVATGEWQQPNYDDDEDDNGYDEDEDEEDEPVFEEEPDVFSLIPKHIKPTRIPGTDEKVNMTGVIVVGVLNVVALILLVVQLVL